MWFFFYKLSLGNLWTEFVVSQLRTFLKGPRTIISPIPSYFFRFLLLIYFLFPVFLWPLLWSSDQSSWLQIQRSGFHSQRYQIFWEVVGLERGPLSLVNTIEELLGRKSSCFGLENRQYDRGCPLRWPRDTVYPQKLALTSRTSGGRSVGIARSLTQATELFCLLLYGCEMLISDIKCGI
jgi:hypothetical protein